VVIALRRAVVNADEPYSKLRACHESGGIFQRRRLSEASRVLDGEKWRDFE
jgi:hypothetical protein